MRHYYHVIYNVTLGYTIFYFFITQYIMNYAENKDILVQKNDKV